LGGFDSHALPPSSGILVTTRFSMWRSRLVAAVLCLVATSDVLSAQRSDSARVAPRPTARDTATRLVILPPLSPRRAFAYSVLVPGLGQSKLNRPVAGAIFVLTESIAIAMLRESMAELREARRFRSDSLVFIGNDPVTGAPVNQPSSFNDQLIELRKGHVEDWIAFLIGNHLFAGADAYVAAHLWDLPGQIEVRPGAKGKAGVTARLRW
jgi:hypothetical protein